MEEHYRQSTEGPQTGYTSTNKNSIQVNLTRISRTVRNGTKLSQRAG